MGKNKNLLRLYLKKLLAFCLVLAIGGVIIAQEVKIISRAPNYPRIVRAWNSIPETTRLWNQAMAKSELLLHARFDGRVIELNEERRQALEDVRRKSCVGHYKEARESLLKQLDALNELIDEEDY